MAREQQLTAADYQGARNRVILSPDLMRRVGRLLGYQEHPMTVDGRVKHPSTVFDPVDMIELLAMTQLDKWELAPQAEEKKESDEARDLVKRVARGEYLTRQEAHDALPAETVVLLKMGPPRLWGISVPQRASDEARDVIPKSVPDSKGGFYTNRPDEWLGEHLLDFRNLRDLETQPEGIDVDDDPLQRLRIGMSLADSYQQVWSSARGHWTINPETRYLVPSRFGWCPYVFKIPEDGWRLDERDGEGERYIATKGYFIDMREEPQLIELGAPDPDNAWLPTACQSREKPSERDVKVGKILTGKIIALGLGHKNPVIRLRQKGRKLF